MQTLPRQTPSGQTHPQDGRCSEQYTSYWNVSLFIHKYTFSFCIDKFQYKHPDKEQLSTTNGCYLIHDFPDRGGVHVPSWLGGGFCIQGAATLSLGKKLLFVKIFAKHCMKMICVHIFQQTPVQRTSFHLKIYCFRFVSLSKNTKILIPFSTHVSQLLHISRQNSPSLI